MNIKVIDEVELLEHAEKIGLERLADYLFYLPIKYHDYTKLIPQAREGLNKDVVSLFKVKVTHAVECDTRARPPRAKVKAHDGVEKVIINVFGGVYDWNNLQIGQIITISGKVEEWNGIISIKSPKIIPTSDQNRIIPQYRAKNYTSTVDKVKVKQELTSEKIAGFVLDLFDDYVDECILKLCNYVNMTESQLLNLLNKSDITIRDIFRKIHFPLNFKEIEESKEIISHINALKIINAAKESTKKLNSSRSIIDINIDDIKDIVSYIPFTLGQEQKRAIWDIIKKLKEHKPLDHLLSGDVGCGKTIVYAVIAVAAQRLGKQVAILIPNLPLAYQVYNEIKETFPFTNVKLIKKGSDYVYDSDNPILVGTSALNFWAKKQKDFSVDLFIVDEQQKTGTSQKEVFVNPSTNTIEATATALPRTLMQGMIGDKTISKIEEPPVQKDITSKIIFKEQKKELFKYIKKTLDSGYQVAILYPLREQASDVSIVINSLNLFCSYVDHVLNNDIVKKIILDNEEKQESVTINKYLKNKDLYSKYSISKIIVDRNSNHGILTETLSRLNVMHVFEDTVNDVERAYSEWSKIFPDRVVMLHGGLSDEEKIIAVEEAKSNKKQIIITSSVIEIGLTIPKLKVFVTVGAKNLGVSTLHQLRGRLSRHGGEGYFFMLVNESEASSDEDSLMRLRLLEKYKKGSDLAKNDMLLRGFGDLTSIGISQSGHLQSVFKGIKLLPEDVFNFIKFKSQRS
jgi:RecG-like helicase